jgi:hypothetical protein
VATANATVEHCIETLCDQGCGRVSEYIEALRAGQVFAEVAGLSETERQMVLAELEAVMAPYQGQDDD